MNEININIDDYMLGPVYTIAELKKLRAAFEKAVEKSTTKEGYQEYLRILSAMFAQATKEDLRWSRIYGIFEVDEMGVSDSAGSNNNH